MPNPYFSFKQFTVYHDRCAMKVGTDGVLIGAWADVSRACRVLDVGTGSGLIALMVAQRAPRALVTGIDIDDGAVGQATANVQASPWAHRIRVCRQDLRTMEVSKGGRFDHIVTNPPYFEEDVFCPHAARNMARHTQSLSLDGLASRARTLLTNDGEFSLILPARSADTFIGTATRHGFHLHRLTYVHTTPSAPAKRVLLAFSLTPCECEEHHLTIELARHVYSGEFTSLVKDFYLAL